MKYYERKDPITGERVLISEDEKKKEEAGAAGAFIVIVVLIISAPFIPGAVLAAILFSDLHGTGALWAIAFGISLAFFTLLLLVARRTPTPVKSSLALMLVTGLIVIAVYATCHWGFDHKFPSAHLSAYFKNKSEIRMASVNDEWKRINGNDPGELRSFQNLLERISYNELDSYGSIGKDSYLKFVAWSRDKWFDIMHDYRASITRNPKFQNVTSQTVAEQMMKDDLEIFMTGIKKSVALVPESSRDAFFEETNRRIADYRQSTK